MKLFNLKRKLQKDGMLISYHFVVSVNNNDLCEFDSREKVFSYLADYEKVNTIFQLSVYRIECYSLIDKI